MGGNESEQSAPMDRAGGGGGLPRLQNMPQLSPLGMGGISSYGAGRFGAQFNPYQARSYQPQTYQPQQLGPARMYGPQAGAAPGAGAGANYGSDSIGSAGGPSGIGETGAPASTPDTSPVGPAAQAAIGMAASMMGVPPGLSSAAINGINNANIGHNNPIGNQTPADVAQMNVDASIANQAAQAEADAAATPDSSSVNAVNGMDSASDSASGGGGGGSK